MLLVKHLFYIARELDGKVVSMNKLQHKIVTHLHQTHLKAGPFHKVKEWVSAFTNWYSLLGWTFMNVELGDLVVYGRASYLETKALFAFYKSVRLIAAISSFVIQERNRSCPFLRWFWNYDFYQNLQENCCLVKKLFFFSEIIFWKLTLSFIVLEPKQNNFFQRLICSNSHFELFHFRDLKLFFGFCMFF